MVLKVVFQNLKDTKVDVMWLLQLDSVSVQKNPSHSLVSRKAIIKGLNGMEIINLTCLLDVLFRLQLQSMNVSSVHSQQFENEF